MMNMVVRLKIAHVLLLQVVDAFIEVWGAGRVGVHLAPRVIHMIWVMRIH
jgi:hypothetical protein